MSNETLLPLPTMDAFVHNEATSNPAPERSPLRDLPDTVPTPREVLDAVSEHLGQPTAEPDPVHNETPLGLPTMQAYTEPTAEEPQASPRTVGDVLGSPHAGHVMTNTGQPVGETPPPLPTMAAYA